MTQIVKVTGAVWAMLFGLMILVVSGCHAPEQNQPPMPATKPNLLIISIDTLRADHLGAYGAWHQQTPCLDRLAQNGQQIVRMVSGSSCTLSSHSTLFTSLFPQTHQADASIRNRLAPRFKTLPEVMQDSGYATGGFTAGGQLMDLSGINQGFDVFQGDLLPGKQIYQRATTWLDTLTGETPFFLFVHHYDVHHPYEGEDVFFKLQAPGVPSGKNGSVFNAPDEEWQKYSDISGTDIHRMYCGAVDSADRLTETLLRKLEAMDLLDNTVIAVVSDHGEEFGERNWWASHGHSVYSEVIDVPCIIAGLKGDMKPRLRNVPAHAVDFMPTLLDLVNVEKPTALEGRNLFTSMFQPERKLYSQCDLYNLPEYRAAVESNHIKMIRQPHGQVETYHLETDPGEQVDLKLSDATETFSQSWTEHLSSVARTRTKIPDPYPVSIHLPVLDRIIGQFSDSIALNPDVALKAWVDLPPGEYDLTLTTETGFSGKRGETVTVYLGSGKIDNKVFSPDSESPEFIICPLPHNKVDEIITMDPATLTVARLNLEENKTSYEFSLTQKSQSNHEIIIDFDGSSQVKVKELVIQPAQKISFDSKVRQELKSLGYIE